MPGYKTDPIRRQLRFYGQVQGVGFRWRAQMAASGLGLTGWVCNLDDDSVLMEIQGTEEKIDLAIQQIEAGTWVRVEDIRVKDLPLIEGERGFHVRG